MDAEGWFRDPYGLHVDRWFSAGRPTSLVRDALGESHDDPPAEPCTGSLIPVEVFEPAPHDDGRVAADWTNPNPGLDEVEMHVAVWDDGYIRRFGMKDPRKRSS